MPTASDLVAFVRCPHRVHLDATADEADAQPASAFLQLLWESGRAHEAEVVRAMGVDEVPWELSRERRVATTLELIRAGCEWIYHGYLRARDLEGEPDLLQRVAGRSDLGGFGYRPVEIKSGGAFVNGDPARPKKAYLIQLCAYAELLQHAQGVRPAEGGIIDGEGQLQVLELAAHWAEYETARAHIGRILAGEEATRPGAKGDCAHCLWRPLCRAELEARSDLTTVAGLGEASRERLESIGIRTVSDLAGAEPEQLVVLHRVGDVLAERWPRQAQVQLDGRPLLLEPWTPPEVDFEVAYDIEDFSPDSFVYLHGLLARDPSGPRFGEAGFGEGDWGEFRPVVAAPGQSELEVWRAFLDEVDRLEAAGEYAVYVYSSHERTMLAKLEERYGGSPALDSFRGRFVDLYEEARRCVVFPTPRYGLKALAEFVGFSWRDEDPGGAESMAWWAEYQKDPAANAPLLERILRYNEDDVRATFALRDWIEEFSRET